MKISYGNSRFEKRWKNKDITFEELCELCKIPRRTTETVAEYMKMTKARRDEAKDHGGFVLGHLKGGRRKKGAVESRSAITLDADHAALGFVEQYEMLCNHKTLIYSTHSHVSEAPRLRLIIPANREMSPEEYAVVARLLASEIGIDCFDDTTYEPERLMYWPSCPADGEYIYRVVDGEPVDVDVYLSKISDWRDCSLWPTSSRQSEIVQRSVAQQQDPLTKDGVVGAFCRAYTIEDAITEFLPEIYTPSAMDGRYDYIPADSSAGVVLYDGKFAYSHHATDPASGKLLNAFDIVRIHKFGDLDEKQSFKVMNEFAVADDKVKTQFVEERREQANADFTEDEDWTKRLRWEKNGTLENSLHNITLILNSDPALKSIVFNQLADGMEIKGEIPWKHPARFWRDADDAQLISYIDANYGTFSARNYEIAVTKVTDDRSYHPIREYLDNLPPWDGIRRVDTLLIDYLGATDTPYVRAVTRKTLCASIARVKTPGIKFDSMLVLNGPQGIGKSTLISKLGGEWFSDSLSLGDTKDKTAAEKLQGYWILEIGELAGLKKTEIETLRSFLSRQNDIYRASFGRRVNPHPRQCIFVGTTNAETGYLRDVAGNRRFWPVKTPGGNTKQSWQLTDGDVSQIWAETLVYANAGEKLYLDPETEKYAKDVQREAMETDDREGLVREYLETLLPDNWSKIELSERIGHLDNDDFSTDIKSTIRRESVCNMEIWCECFRRERTSIQRKDSYEISAIMTRIGGWRQNGRKVKSKIYGVQTVWERVVENGCSN